MLNIDLDKQCQLAPAHLTAVQHEVGGSSLFTIDQSLNLLSSRSTVASASLTADAGMPSAIASSILGLNDSFRPADHVHSTTQRSSPKMTTPLIDRTNTTATKSSRSTVMTTANSTTFLPEMHSTPPMPTFQKPDMATPSTPVRTLDIEKENDNGTPTRSYIPRRPVPVHGHLSTTSATRAAFAKPRAVHSTTLPADRVSETPPLPHNWTSQHDRAICILDARNYTLSGIVAKIRRTFPDLRGTLTPSMVDKRLRQLDQDVNIDYWAVGLAKAGGSSSGKKRHEGHFTSSMKLPSTADSALMSGTTVVEEAADELSKLRVGRHRAPLNDHL